jgi:hypothetical protein
MLAAEPFLASATNGSRWQCGELLFGIHVVISHTQNKRFICKFLVFTNKLDIFFNQITVIPFCPNTPPVSQYTFLGLYTCVVGTFLREIYCDLHHLLVVRMPKPMFHMSNKAFHPCTTVKGTLFSA